MDLSNLNKINNINFVRFKDLTPGEIYKITEIKPVNTKFGTSFTVELNNSFSCYLPKRTIDFLSANQEELAKLISNVKNNALGLKFIVIIIINLNS